MPNPVLRYHTIPAKLPQWIQIHSVVQYNTSMHCTCAIHREGHPLYRAVVVVCVSAPLNAKMHAYVQYVSITLCAVIQILCDTNRLCRSVEFCDFLSQVMKGLPYKLLQAIVLCGKLNWQGQECLTVPCLLVWYLLRLFSECRVRGWMAWESPM